MAYIYPFRMASGTATMLLIDPHKREVILGIRNESSWVYPKFDSLPGGFMEARFTEEQAKKLGDLPRRLREELNMDLIAAEFHEGENLEQTAIRELKEELNIDVDERQLNMFAVRSNSRTDTRAHVINACYWLEITPEQRESMVAGDDLEAIKPVSFDDIPHLGEMAFNHHEVLIQGYRHYLRHKLFVYLTESYAESRMVQDFIEEDCLLAIVEKSVANG